MIIQPHGSSTATCISTAPQPLTPAGIQVPEASTRPNKKCSRGKTNKANKTIPENNQTDTQNFQNTDDSELNDYQTSLIEEHEHTPDCDGELDPNLNLNLPPLAENEEFQNDVIMTQTEDNDNINLEQNSTAENDSVEESVFECDVSDSKNTMVEEHTKTMTQVEEAEVEAAVDNDERQLHKDGNNETPAMNTQSDSILKENIVEASCESVKIYGKEEEENICTGNMPLLQCSPDQASLCESTPPSSPEKLGPATTSFPSQHLFLCTPFATPQKPEDQSSSPMSLSTSPLHTPILAASSLVTSPDKAMQGLRQRNLTSELETTEKDGAAGSVVKNMSQGVHKETTTIGKGATALKSVIQGSVLSKEKEDRPLHLINITSNKLGTRLRKISPAKTFKSPIKTSPLKQVSPILRKYHKYSPKKRNIRSGKLLPILPKFTVSQRETC